MPPSWPKQDQAQNLDDPTWGSLQFFRGKAHGLWELLRANELVWRYIQTGLPSKLLTANKKAETKAYGDNRPLTSSDQKELKTLLIS